MDLVSPTPWVALPRPNFSEPRLQWLTFSHIKTLDRHESGLFSCGQELYPRVTIEGINWAQIVRLLINSRNINLNLEGEYVGRMHDFGFVEMDENDEERSRRHVKKVHLSLALEAAGLSINYRAFSLYWKERNNGSGWFEGSVALSWELVIIYFPELANRWKSIWRNLP